MGKKDDFKSFVSSHPNLISVVSSKKRSWQDLYEVFDLYGTDDSLWDKYLRGIDNVKESSGASIGELTKLFKSINIENVQKYIDTAQKAIGIVQELTGGASAGAAASSGPTSARPINKIFED